MANQFQNVTSGLGSLKIYYEGPIQDRLSNELPVLRACEKVTKGWSGQQVNRPLRLIRNQGIGATSDGGNLPNIGRQTTQQAVIQARYNYWMSEVQILSRRPNSSKPFDQYQMAFSTPKML